MRFYNDKIQFWKVGITQISVISRFGTPQNCKMKFGLDYEVLSVEEKNFYECYLEEQTILEKFKENRISIDYNGFTSTECFNVNILGKII